MLCPILLQTPEGHDSGKKNVSSCRLPKMLNFSLQNSLFFPDQKKNLNFHSKILHSGLHAQVSAPLQDSGRIAHTYEDHCVYTQTYGVLLPRALCMHPLANCLITASTALLQPAGIYYGIISGIFQTMRQTKTQPKKSLPSFSVRLFFHYFLIPATPVSLDQLDTKLASPLGHVLVGGYISLNVV